ncbi:MAG: CPBP family intramembrane metalloprotease [Phycisphaerales bacterium]|nr:CPBP family intramembrane metalloprotease [Phycisphaerales bacterium]
MSSFPPASPPPFPPFNAPPDPFGPAPRTRIALGGLGAAAAWVVILVITLGLVITVNLPKTEIEGGRDVLGLRMMQMQAQYLLAIAPSEPASRASFLERREIEQINTGSIAQRLRFAVVAGDLGGPAAALGVLDELEQRVNDHNAEAASNPRLTRVEWTADEAAALRLLRTLYDARTGGAPGNDVLSADDIALLERELEWFARLALNPPGGDEAARKAVMAPATRLLVIMVTMVIAGLCVGGLGLIGLIVLFILAAMGTVRMGVAPSRAPAGVYAETFAFWLLLFFGLQVVIETAPVPPGSELFAGAVAFFISLLALAWPCIRGVSWRDARRDIGLTLGRGGVLEPAFGVAAYAMMLPFLAVGVLVTLMLVFIAGAVSGAVPDTGLGPFSPSGGPAHPLLGAAGTPWWTIIQMYLVASVAAPVVEEIMFRGVLYRNLRTGLGALGPVMAAVVGTCINALIFAAIPPQGWVAIPALGGIAVGMTVAREWRDSLVAPILVHAISNGVVTTIMLVVLAGG